MRKIALVWKLSILLCFSVLQVTAQEKVVSGLVTDLTDATPIQNASVKIKGTAIGTQTNSSGYFNLKVAPGKTLVFSFVGYNTVEVKVGAENTINVKLGND